MDHDDVALRVARAERVGHRILTPAAARNDPQRLAGTVEREPINRAQVRGRIRDDVRRQRDDDLVDVGMREKRGHAALENLAAADRQELFAPFAAKPPATPAGGDDRCDMHVSCSISLYVIHLRRATCA
jgi:hypothetical protein